MSLAPESLQRRYRNAAWIINQRWRPQGGGEKTFCRLTECVYLRWFKVVCSFFFTHTLCFPNSCISVSFLSYSRTQSVCDAARPTSPSRALWLPPPVRLEGADLSRGDTAARCFMWFCFLFAPRENRRGPASSWTSGTASRSRTPTWAGPMTASSTSTEPPGSTEWRRWPRTARAPTAACCSCTSPVRGPGCHWLALDKQSNQCGS